VESTVLECNYTCILCYRYKKLDRIEEERKIILLNHLGFMECPSKDRCHFREKCAENKVQLLLASRPVRYVKK
jgi:hypothetical protein